MNAINVEDLLGALAHERRDRGGVSTTSLNVIAFVENDDRLLHWMADTSDAFAEAHGFRIVLLDGSRTPENHSVRTHCREIRDTLVTSLEQIQLGVSGMGAPELRSVVHDLLVPSVQNVLLWGGNHVGDERFSSLADLTERIVLFSAASNAALESLRELTRLHDTPLAARIRDLAPEAETRWYVDTGPVMEKAWAQQAGLGWIGKHSNLVSTRFGSWLLLGEILTTLELDADEPGADLCGSCTLCIRACPTGAIVEPYVVDARRCISYLTIELPRTGEAVPDELSSRLGNRIFGCDDCLDICPYNVSATPTAERAFHPSAFTLAPQLDHCARMTESEFAERFRLSPIRRAKHAGFLRNIAMAFRNKRPVHTHQS